jgi:hypothetical protein
MLVALARNPPRPRIIFPVSCVGQQLMGFDIVIEECDRKYVRNLLKV